MATAARALVVCTSATDELCRDGRRQKTVVCVSHADKVPKREHRAVVATVVPRVQPRSGGVLRKGQCGDSQVDQLDDVFRRNAAVPVVLYGDGLASVDDDGRTIVLDPLGQRVFTARLKAFDDRSLIHVATDDSDPRSIQTRAKPDTVDDVGNHTVLCENCTQVACDDGTKDHGGAPGKGGATPWG